MKQKTPGPVDICLILEGTYPYIMGGVANWTHELIKRQDHLTFHVISILPRDERPPQRFDLPDNVKGLTTLHLQNLPRGKSIPKKDAQKLFETMRYPLLNITTGEAFIGDFQQMMDAVEPYRERMGSHVMLDSEAAWNLLTSMYEATFSESSMLDYFWTWRAMMANFYSLMLAPLPEAKCYHAMSTGYAGLFAARAKTESKKPVILTEHGIYTNERRIEIVLADWLDETASKAMTIDRIRRDLHDMWIDTFANYSRICYGASDHIITLFTGNQFAQIADGADPKKMRVIPNGIDTEYYGSIERVAHERPTMALIGRVVPIKDIKNFLRATANVRQHIPDIRSLVIGPLNEDPSYAEECQSLVEHLGLQDTVTFTGQVNIARYLPEIDVLVSSSISEAQPLAILEAGASGIPAVVTDVGACAEMVLGKVGEDPAFGPGGIVVQLSSPMALAQGIITLLSDRELYDTYSRAIRSRVNFFYNKADQYQAYKQLYASCIDQRKD